MDHRAVFAAQIVLNLVSYTLILRWFVLPRLRGLTLQQALIPLVAIHWIRTLGGFAVFPVFTGPIVSQSDWAQHVAIGDLTTVVLALAAVGALRARHRLALPMVWLFNIVGSIDVINAGVNAIRERILAGGVPPQGLVVAFGVPVLIVTHIAIFVLLIRGRVAQSAAR